MNKNRYFTFIVIFSISFMLNFIWENSHSVLYSSNIIGIQNHLYLMLYASFVDAFFIILAFTFLGLINKKFNWKLNKKNLLIFSLILMVISLILEKRAILSNRWVYSSAMSTMLGIGISPLIQLAITGILTLIILSFLNLREHKNMKGGNKK